MTIADDMLDQENWTRPVVLMLTDDAELTDIRPLARRGNGPTLYSLTIDSRGHARGILATTAQLMQHRALIDQAITRIVAQEPPCDT